MLDFNNLQQYRENNRIEAKKALGGLPKSIWETYSAFANTHGGFILLGVEELPDKSLHAVNLPDPHRLIREFWEIINDPDKVSVNILSCEDVFVQEVEGCRIVVIHVPRGERSCKPVSVEGNRAYRRNGEGDYRCTQEEYQAMVRDASVKTQDMLLLQDMDLSVLHRESIRSYRQRLRLAGHVWEALEDDALLLKLGAIGICEDEKKHPTAAGLLMFGNEQDIVQAFPNYLLDYREQDGSRIVSSCGDWSGNVYDFYFRVYDRLIRNIEAPPQSASVHQSLREALVNCLVNADYYGRQGLVITKTQDSITMENPGSFRIEVAAAKNGGISDPRNGAMLKMFHLINIGKRIGSGIPSIFRVWRQLGWADPQITEASEPDRILVSLPLHKKESQNTVPSSIHNGRKTAMQKNAVLEYLTDHPCAKCSDICQMLGIRDAEHLLRQMVEEGTVIADTQSKTYRLKF